MIAKTRSVAWLPRIAKQLVSISWLVVANYAASTCQAQNLSGVNILSNDEKCHIHIDISSSYYGHTRTEIDKIVRSTLACHDEKGGIVTRSKADTPYILRVNVSRLPPPQTNGHIIMTLYFYGKLIGKTWISLSPFAAGNPTMMVDDLRSAYKRAFASVFAPKVLSLGQ